MNKEQSNISIRRQTDLLDISRSSVYYQPAVDSEDILIMNAIDEIFTRYPFYGHRRIKPELQEEYGLDIGKKRIISLMKEMGLNAIYPRKKLSLSDPNKQHKKFPYLLKGLPIIRSNQIWGTDITYIKLKKHFAYLVAILDWYSRYVITWKLSPTLENIFCIQALKEALKINTADIHNSDQGVQYTSIDYINILEENKIRISMDGRGRCMDNIFTERLWRTVKYENVYLNEYGNIGEADQGLSEYFKFYNEKRRHQSLDYKTPAQIYFSK
ncbi:MAG: IS3 family transposase [bacterium]|nr:IS3 family transposase [bacterium]